MPRGRPKKPDVIKRLDGNPGKRPLNGEAPQPAGVLVIPDYVTGHAEEIWHQIVDSMPGELYTTCDSVVLAAFCVAVSQFRQATEEVAREGLTMKTMHGEWKPHPALTAQSKALTTIALLGPRLGLDPSSRASLKMPPEKKALSKFSGLIAGKTGRGG